MLKNDIGHAREKFVQDFDGFAGLHFFGHSRKAAHVGKKQGDTLAFAAQADVGGFGGNFSGNGGRKKAFEGLELPGRATVQGRLHAAQVRPVRENNVLACEVADSTGELTAVFYGRTQIAGIEPGRQVRLHGMVGIDGDGHPAMINPACELLR